MWKALCEYCGAGILPHPADDLEEFYGLDGDHLGDLVEEAFVCLEITMPSPAEPEIVPGLATAADLCLYLEARRRELSKSA